VAGRQSGGGERAPGSRQRRRCLRGRCRVALNTMDTMEIDDLSLRLLQLLERDASASVAQLATMLGATPEEIARRIEELEKARGIVRRKTVVNWERTGEEPVAALIEVKVSPQRDVGFDAIALRIARYPETRSVYLASGTYDLAVEVVGRTMKDVANF